MEGRQVVKTVAGCSVRRGATLADFGWMPEGPGQIGCVRRACRGHELEQCAAENGKAHESHGQRS